MFVVDVKDGVEVVVEYLGVVVFVVDDGLWLCVFVEWYLYVFVIGWVEVF